MFYKFTITGVVQGVGFRPFVYNACKDAKICGYVQNTGKGVVVVVNNKEAFKKILASPPALSRIDSISIEEIGGSYTNFTIRESAGNEPVEIPADLYLCADCLKELNDADNRRNGYFFITCTNCGPRFSIVERAPYDRANTTMREFLMCADCKEEYENPHDRRFHAETIACPACGPEIKLTKNHPSGTRVVDEVVGASSIETAAELIKHGEIVAVKGVGGFHLICNTKARTVKALRTLTGRAHKPYAVMVRDINSARAIARINKIEEKLLLSPARPIVVLKTHSPYTQLGSSTSKLGVVSELDSIGIMLPYTALHYLLFQYINELLVCTSSNMPDEPLTSGMSEQFVPLVLNHNRKIANSIDDSVVKVVGNTPIFLRRSRGYVPQSISIFVKNARGLTLNKSILALGAELNNTICIYKNRRAILSQYIGNTANLSVFARYQKTVERFLNFTGCVPDVVLCDLHPDYNTTRFARDFARTHSIPLVQIQHHKAHVYSVALEYGLTDFVGIACDGLGYGEDGTIWGGEVFENDKRVGHLEQHAQIGADTAARYPARMLLSVLDNFLLRKELKKYIGGHFNDQEIATLLKQKEEQFNAPLTSSCGRVLDAASVLLGFCSKRTYEGRPAMLLEACSGTPYKLTPIIQNNVLMTTPLFEFLIRNIRKDKTRLAATVQQYIAEGLYKIAAQYNKPIVFSGGCAANSIMTKYFLQNGVLVNRKVPPGDGGISFGQIAYITNHTDH